MSSSAGIVGAASIVALSLRLMFDWNDRGVLTGLAVWCVLLAVGLVLYFEGEHGGALAVATAGFFLAPFFMVLGGRSR
jgi:drug/metabolite transporter (DMT)-like permease